MGHVIGLKLYTCVLQEVSIRNACITVHSSGRIYFGKLENSRGVKYISKTSSVMSVCLRDDPLGGSRS